MSAPSPDTTYDITIDRIVGDGKGIGFADAKTFFVGRTAPGDRVRVRPFRQQKNVIHGTVEKVLSASEQRIDPDCPYYERCGGCDLMHIGYDDQLAAKVAMVEDALRRIAKLPDHPPVKMVASPDQWGYRSRAEWQVSAESGIVGYFAENSKTIVDVEHCAVSTDTINLLLQTLRDDVDAELVPAAAREYRAVATQTGTALEQTTTQRSNLLQWHIGNEDYRFSAECFFQTNIPLTERLVADVIRMAQTARAEPGMAVDLYCGVGLFTLPLARIFKRVIGVESHKPAIGFAQDNLSAAGLDKAKLIAQPVEHWVSGDNSRYGKVSLMVFDPPRTGAGPRAVAGMIRMNPAHIVAVSCDPATFARDVRGLIDGGYRVESVTAYDMFPQTHHVEVVAHIVRA